MHLVESQVLALVIVALLNGCSSDDSNEGGGSLGGSGGAAPTGSGGSIATGAGGAAPGSPGTAAAGGGGAGTPATNDPPGFADDIWPILRANCANVSCHGDGSFLPQHAHSDVEVAYDEAQPVADLIAGRVSGQLMPIMPQFCGPAPGLGECLSIDEVRLIEAWAEGGAPR